jgi:hypothetical protein
MDPPQAAPAHAPVFTGAKSLNSSVMIDNPERIKSGDLEKDML